MGFVADAEHSAARRAAAVYARQSRVLGSRSRAQRGEQEARHAVEVPPSLTNPLEGHRDRNHSASCGATGHRSAALRSSPAGNGGPSSAQGRRTTCCLPISHVDRGRAGPIQRQRETQAVDGISFAVHPGRHFKYRPPLAPGCLAPPSSWPPSSTATASPWTPKRAPEASANVKGACAHSSRVSAVQQGEAAALDVVHEDRRGLVVIRVGMEISEHQGTP
jgi:hypothetical protein